MSTQMAGVAERCAVSTRTLNFSGGPGALPEPVLHQVRDAVLEVPSVGQSVLGISHRSDWFRDVVDEAEANFRALLDIPDHYRVLFLQGGGTQQFAMVPLTLLQGRGGSADYIDGGYWSSKSIAEARKFGDVRVVWSGAPSAYTRLPDPASLIFSPSASYLHYVSNETVEGLQFHTSLGLDSVRRVCDMSSDFAGLRFDINRFAVVYAHAQKNLGPAGVTLAIVREDVLDEVPADLPAVFDYRLHADAGSIYNTPPVFAIYVTLLVSRWLRYEVGGVAAMETLNRRKAALLYDTIDSSGGFYRGHAMPASRSLMNVTFRLPSRDLEVRFLEASGAEGFYGLAGHRSLGGIRASLYNAVTVGAVEKLCDFMRAFRAGAGR